MPKRPTKATTKSLPGRKCKTKGGDHIKRTGFHKVLIVCILAASMAAVILFQSNMIQSVNRASEKKVLSLLSDNANQVRSVLDSQINSIWNHMDTIDSALGTIREMTKTEAVSFLDSMVSRAYQVELVTEDGEYLNQFGKTGYVVPDEDAFRLFIDQEPICVLRQEAQEDTLMFGAPVSPVKVDGKEYAYVLAYFRLDALMRMLAVESFAGKGQIRVLDQDGFVIISSDNVDQDKTSYYFFKVYQDGKFIENDAYSGFEGFRQSVMAGENNAVHVVREQEYDHVISYAKTERLNWYVTIVVDYTSVLGELEKEIRAIGTSSIVFTVAVVIIALILVALISAGAYKVRQEKQQLQELNASLDNAKRVAEQALEIAESANRSKSFFLSNMSHDIRTPINAITGFTTLLAKNANDPEKVLEYTKKISSSSRHLLGLISDVLDMSKIESGTTTLSLSEEKIGDIVSDLDAIIRPQMIAKDHTFHISVQNITHERILVDKTRLNQIMMNLLSNAVKYTPNGERINLDISETKSAQNTAWYEFCVSDNGYGMSQEFIETIFDSFSREEDSRTSRIQGTGLGMAITKHLVDLMGGSIDVKSQKGRGSVFTVSLQFQLGRNEQTPLFWKEYGISHCLVVDDEEVICQNVVLSMESTGVKTDYVLDGASALEKVQGHDAYQLALLDYKMPVMDGLETAKRLRGLLPENASILLLTGFDFTDLEAEQLAGIVDGVLPKPFFVSTLKQKLVEIHSQDEDPAMDAGDSKEHGILYGKHILIAEDNDLNSEILQDMLSDYGAECVIRENGQLVVETFEKSRPGDFDLIFMDVQMPVMNGHQATRPHGPSGPAPTPRQAPSPSLP